MQNNPCIEPLVEPGCVVSLKDAIVLKTVESLQEMPFGAAAQCIWFGEADSFHFRSVPLAQLDLFPHPAGGDPVFVGQTLRLKSGGPVMSVLDYDPKTRHALCEWDAPSGRARRRRFHARTLSAGMLNSGSRGYDGEWASSF